MTPEEQALYDYLISTGVSPEEAEQAVVGSRTSAQPSIPSGITPASASNINAWGGMGGSPYGPSAPTTSFSGGMPDANDWSVTPPAGYHRQWDTNRVRYVWEKDSGAATKPYVFPIPAEPGEPTYQPGQWITRLDPSTGEFLTGYYDSSNIWHTVSQQEKRELSPGEAARLAWEKEKYAGKPQPSNVPEDKYGRKAFWTGQGWDYPPDWGRPGADYINPAEQQRIALEQQQLANTQSWQQQQLVAQKEERLASLRARPSSWLEYASLSGQAPVVQPWMTGLLPQGSNLTAGQAIPGYSAGGTSMNLPELTRPSSQYQARIGPVPTQQYYGYEQARTGVPPEQTAWYLGELSAPGGRFSGLSRRR